MSKFNSCLRNGFVSFGDDFDVVAEVTHLFGVNASKLPYHNWFKLPGKMDVITWLPSEDGGNMPDNLRVRIGSVASAAGKLRFCSRSRMNEARA